MTPSSSLFCFLLLFSQYCIPIVEAQSCTFYDQYSDYYDLSSLTGVIAQVTTGSSIFTFWPCQNDCRGPQGTYASLCQNDLQGNPVAPLSIFDNTMTWSSFSSNGVSGVQFTTQNGGPPSCYNGSPRFATMQFVCDYSGVNTFSVVNIPSLSYCGLSPGYTFQYTTPYACQGYSPVPTTVDTAVGALSAAVIIIIVVATVVPILILVVVVVWVVRRRRVQLTLKQPLLVNVQPINNNFNYNSVPVLVDQTQMLSHPPAYSNEGQQS